MKTYIFDPCRLLLAQPASDPQIQKVIRRTAWPDRGLGAKPGSAELMVLM
jgi:hypothetical protein